MKSRTTIEFRKLFAGLPKQVQDQTRAAYQQFKEDPSYPAIVAAQHNNPAAPEPRQVLVKYEDYLRPVSGNVSWLP